MDRNLGSRRLLELPPNDRKGAPAELRESQHAEVNCNAHLAFGISEVLMAITFPVDKVTPHSEACELITLHQSLPERIGDGLCVSHGPTQVVRTGTTHPLVAAIHLAFAEHRPL